VRMLSGRDGFAKSCDGRYEATVSIGGRAQRLPNSRHSHACAGRAEFERELQLIGMSPGELTGPRWWGSAVWMACRSSSASNGFLIKPTAFSVLT